MRAFVSPIATAFRSSVALVGTKNAPLLPAHGETERRVGDELN